jgi:hypothetical protein
MPWFIPKAWAAVTPPVLDPTFAAEFEQFLKSLKQTDLARIAQEANRQVGIGAMETAIRSGGHSGQALQNLTQARDALKQAAPAAGAGGAAVAAGYIPPPVMAMIKGGLAVGGVGLIMTDWTQVIGQGTGDLTIEERQEWIQENIYRGIDNHFYNWAGNYNWVTAATMKLYSDREYETRAEMTEHYWELTQSGWASINSFFGNLFGRNPGIQELPALNMYQAFDAMNIVEVSNPILHNFVRDFEKAYRVPIGTIVRDNYGLSIGIRHSTVYRDGQMSPLREGNKVVFDIVNRWPYTYANMQTGGGVAWEIDNLIYIEGEAALLVILSKPGAYEGLGWPRDYDTNIMPVSFLDSGGVMAGHPNMIMRSTDLGIPSTPFNNNIDALREQLNRVENKLDNLVIQFPQIEPSGDDYIDLWRFTEALESWSPFAPLPDPGAGTEPGAGTDPGTNPNPTPQPDPGDTIPDIPQELQNVRLPPGIIDKFPFSIPFTIIAVYRTLMSEPVTPVFHIPFAIPMVGIQEEIIVDLSMFDPVMEVLRWLLILLFMFGLALVTRPLIKG